MLSGQCDDKGRAPVQFTLYANLSPIKCNQFVGQAEPNPRALLHPCCGVGATVEPVEQALLFFFGDARPCIGYGDCDGLFGGYLGLFVLGVEPNEPTVGADPQGVGAIAGCVLAVECMLRRGALGIGRSRRIQNPVFRRGAIPQCYNRIWYEL